MAGESFTNHKEMGRSALILSNQGLGFTYWSVHSPSCLVICLTAERQGICQGRFISATHLWLEAGLTTSCTDGRNLVCVTGEDVREVMDAARSYHC
jgi:hypothetical protein